MSRNSIKARVTQQEKKHTQLTMKEDVFAIDGGKEIRIKFKKNESGEFTSVLALSPDLSIDRIPRRKQTRLDGIDITFSIIQFFLMSCSGPASAGSLEFHSLPELISPPVCQVPLRGCLVDMSARVLIRLPRFGGEFGC